MPKRTDLHKILVIGSGPIVIGQACEFDYSGTQAIKALREEGYEVVLINSNPATIMTDPEYAHRTYIEPITWEFVAKIIEKERPDAILPTVGGQTALNTAMSLHKHGVLEKFQVELIGAKPDAIARAEDRKLFKEAMLEIGVEVPKSGLADTLDEARSIMEVVGLPCIIRPAYTLGGSGGSMIYNREEFDQKVLSGIEASPINQVLIEESILGWKEFELEVMRDLNDNVVIICSIENLDPMGIHTGDSITVAPQQTLTDRQYQELRNQAIKIIRKIGVDTGGSNIQFGVHPQSGRIVVIEMNPRVSRSSALASKATGYPIAKIAAKLAVGYTLDEIPNDITKTTPASFEPTLDYVVVKSPRWAFEKFPDADHHLGPQMKSVGEAMAIGRTFQESMQKALRSLETDRYGLGMDGNGAFMRLLASQPEDRKRDFLRNELVNAGANRIFFVYEALRYGFSPAEIYQLTAIDPWFLDQFQEIIQMEDYYRSKVGDLLQNSEESYRELLWEMKRAGFSDRQLAYMEDKSQIDPLLLSDQPLEQRAGNIILTRKEKEIRERREKWRIVADHKMVDTCGGEFQAQTPYLYNTYESQDECSPTNREKVVIIGGGPNRIGQGIEFDYCCSHAAFALADLNVESIMINSNPETVSTDYDTSDRLYFDPLTLEDLLTICKKENPKGVIVQFGGQTPLKLAKALKAEGIPILGTQPEAIDRAENRELFAQVVKKLNLLQPDNGIATNESEAVEIAQSIGYPALVRPSYVLGGRAMAIVFDESGLRNYIKHAVDISPDHPILIDQFLTDATEVDVDALYDGEQVLVAGIMEHIEEAGVHSGDSACSLPPQGLSDSIIKEIETTTEALARELNVHGLINIQYAVKEQKLFIIEVNPRASRTVPFVSKAIGIPLAKVATRLMLGQKLKDFHIPNQPWKTSHVSVKEVVLPFNKFPGVDTILGPEMKSTGEVMGIAKDFPLAFYKASIAAGDTPPRKGNVFFSINNRSKEQLLPYAQKLHQLGFQLYGTEGTADFFQNHGLECTVTKKVHEGRPNIVDLIKSGTIQLVINTPTSGRNPRIDALSIRQAALKYGIPAITTVPGARAAISGIEAILSDQNREGVKVLAIQDYNPDPQSYLKKNEQRS